MQGRIAHLKTAHQENVFIKYATFGDMDNFLRWKSSEEKSTQTSFVQQCGTKKRKTEECTHYYCNRHGHYQPQGNGKRAMKSQGTCKVGDKCTAYMKMTKCLANGTISVEYCTNHTPLSFLLSHTSNFLSHLLSRQNKLTLLPKAVKVVA